MSIPTFLRTQRTLCGLSVAKAAAKSGISYWTWRNVEQGQQKPPSPDIARRMAEVLHCAPNDLYNAALDPAQASESEVVSAAPAR